MPTPTDQHSRRLIHRRQPVSLAEWWVRFFAVLAGIFGFLLVIVTLAWYYWFVVRPGAASFCYENGHETVDTELSLWPLGAECISGVRAYHEPGWGPTLSFLAGMATMVAAVVVPHRQQTGPARRRPRMGSLDKASLRRFFAGWFWLAVLGLVAVGLTLLWFSLAILRYGGLAWCQRQAPPGHTAPSAYRVSWWPMGAECTYIGVGTNHVPGWGPTLIVLTGMVAIVVAFLVPMLRWVARHRTDARGRVPTVRASRGSVTFEDWWWRTLAVVIGVFGWMTVALVHDWHEWLIVESMHGWQWCTDEAPRVEGLPHRVDVTWWPLGANCTYGFNNTYEIPGWGPTFIMLAGITAMAAPIAVPVVQAVAWRLKTHEKPPVDVRSRGGHRVD